MPLGMDFADIAAILTEINKLATGQTPTSPIVDTSSFVSVAQATLLTGPDNYTKAISQVLGRTIFAVRPYDAPLKRLQVTGDDWSNHVRKINFCDTDPVTDKASRAPRNWRSSGLRSCCTFLTRSRLTVATLPTT